MLSLNSAAFGAAGVSLCSWQSLQSQQRPLTVESTVAPPCATPTVAAESWVAAPAEALPLDGLAPDEFAYLHCAKICVADLVIVGTWTRITAYGAPAGVLDPRVTASELAGQAVTRLHPSR